LPIDILKDAPHREGDVIECPLFPGLRIDTVEVFAR
jgi:hypothetical protein